MTIFGPLGPSLAPAIRNSKTLSRWIKPLANAYVNLSGYRKVGLRYDDLLVEEREDVQRALSRLTPRETYDRSFRFKRACQASILHDNLPKDQWTKPEEDVRYLRPHVQEVEREDNERRVWDHLHVERK